jgi:quercetin dioxygenase-like cupin family protein
MRIVRSGDETAKGLPERFTGDVYLDPISAPAPPSRLLAAVVHFTPGARTVWHTHPVGQTIFVTEGVGRCQREGGPVEVVRPGDSVFFEPDESHWHGAAPDRFMVHTVMQETDDAGRFVVWGAPVSEEEYRTAPGP